MDPSTRRCSRRPRAVVVAATFLVVVTAAARVLALGQEFIPLENWSYRAIERFEALGMCVLPDDRPFTRGEFIDLVTEISTNAFDRRLSPRDRYNLDRLEKEYTEFSSRRDAQYRYDPPTFYLQDSPLTLEGDVDIIGAAEKTPPGDDTEFFARSNPEFKLHFGDRVTYDVRYRWEFGPENAGRRNGEKPSRRLRSFRGLTSEFERSYVIVAWDKVHAFVGRAAVDWGPSDWGNLITPGAARTLDQVGVRVRLKALRLSAFHAQLSPLSRRYLAGHRLEVRWGHTVLGINETALYAGKGIEPIYSFPLSSFYANQYNERDNDDNILWSVDAKTLLFRHLALYGSFLIDDFQYEPEGDPNKLAFDVGMHLALGGALPATVRARYRFVDIYTYTHLDSLTDYLTGEAQVGAGDVPLGGAPGPDSDAWRVEAEVFPWQNVVVTGSAWGMRRGAGNDYRAFVDGADTTPEFPLPVVERATGFSGALRYEFNRNRYAVGQVGYESVDNIGHVDGNDDSGVSFRLAIHWEFL